MLPLRLTDQCKVTAESHSENSECRLLTVMPVTGPWTWLLGHGEQGVGDVGQKAVQVKHVCLHGRSLRLLVHLIGPFLQLGLADLTLEHTRPNHFKSASSDIQSQSLIYPLEGSLQTGLKRQSDALLAFGSPHLYMICPAFGVLCQVWKCLLPWEMHANTKKQLNLVVQ